MFKKFLLNTVLNILFTIIIFAHGVNAEIINKGIGISARYDDNSPISFAETKIFSPNNMKIPFQEGLTDKNGTFVFLPDRPGNWKIIVNDGMGHGIVKIIKINSIEKFKQKHSASLSLWNKILIGLSVIFVITGILQYIKIKKALETSNKKRGIDAHS